MNLIWIVLVSLVGICSITSTICLDLFHQTSHSVYIVWLLKPGFHTCVSRTHNSARWLKMYGHQWSQAITAFATKACELATKSHMLNFCEGLCRYRQSSFLMASPSDCSTLMCSRFFQFFQVLFIWFGYSWHSCV